MADSSEKTIAWRRSTFCNGASTCAEVSPLPGGYVGVRDSKLGDSSPVLRFSGEEWLEFSRFMNADDMGNYLGPVLLGCFDDDWWEMAHRDEPKVSLTFDDAEAEAFVNGVCRGEFTPWRLAMAGDGSGVDSRARGAGAVLAASEASQVSR